MTVGLHIAVSLEMPHWLELADMVSEQQWLAFNQWLSFAASIGLH